MLARWLLDLAVKPFLIFEAKNGSPFGARNCDLGSLVPLFLLPGDPFWHLGGFFGLWFAARKDTWSEVEKFIDLGAV